jgi:hypothetical protein
LLASGAYQMLIPRAPLDALFDGTYVRLSF